MLAAARRPPRPPRPRRRASHGETHCKGVQTVLNRRRNASTQRRRWQVTRRDGKGNAGSNQKANADAQRCVAGKVRNRAGKVAGRTNQVAHASKSQQNTNRTQRREAATHNGNGRVNGSVGNATARIAIRWLTV